MLALLKGVANPMKILRATRGEVNWTDDQKYAEIRQIRLSRNRERSTQAQMIVISQPFTVSHIYVQFAIM